MGLGVRMGSAQTYHTGGVPCRCVSRWRCGRPLRRQAPRLRGSASVRKHHTTVIKRSVRALVCVKASQQEWFRGGVDRRTILARKNW